MSVKQILRDSGLFEECPRSSYVRFTVCGRRDASIFVQPKGLKFDLREPALDKGKFPNSPRLHEFASRNNQSKNVDYFALSQDRECAFLVELKTDMESIDRKREQERICLLKSKTVTQIIDDLKLIAKSKSVRSNKHTRGKYFHLFLELEELGLINVPRRSDLEKSHSSSRYAEGKVRRVH